MHIPDGFLDTKTLAASAVFASAGVSIALARSRSTLPPSRVPLLGMTAAFLFAAQMVNFPVLGGTSGHLVGSVLAAVLLGPSGAVVALTSVLLVQAFLFADGGILALGANVLNMAVAAPLCGYGLYRILTSVVGGRTGQIFAAGVSSWVSIVFAALLCSGELAWSGTVPWHIIFPAMAGVHMIIGIGEALITMLILAAILRTRPGLLENGNEGKSSKASIVAYGILLTCVIALFLAPFASPWPDGLESVASKLGFASRAFTESAASSPLAGYHLPGITSPYLAAGLTGLLGAAVVAALSYFFARFIVSHATTTNRRPRS